MKPSGQETFGKLQSKGDCVLCFFDFSLRCRRPIAECTVNTKKIYYKITKLRTSYDILKLCKDKRMDIQLTYEAFYSIATPMNSLWVQE